MKKILLLALIIILGIFIYLKIQVSGGPNSQFNQTTRFTLGKSPITRTILGLHSAGDARAEYLSNSGPLVIEWFKPVSEDVDSSVLNNFADAVSKYTGRPVSLAFGGGIDDNTVDLSNLDSFNIKAAVQKPKNSSVLSLFFVQDYNPKQQGELATTYQESAAVVSLNAHRNFLNSYAWNLNQYLLASLLHEFGRQIGLKDGADDGCIMNQHAGINGQPMEAFGRSEPQDFCPAEVNQINNLKSQLGR